MNRFLKFVPYFLLIVILGCDSKHGRWESHQQVMPEEFDKKFPVSQLKEDIDFLFQTLEAVHPNLYAFTPQAEVKSRRAKIQQDLTSPLSRIDFYIRIAPLVAGLGDGHTFVRAPGEEFNHYAENKGLLFPLDLDFREKRAFVTANYSPDSLITMGSEILSINGITVGNILDSLLQFVSGEKASFRGEVLERRFRHMLWLVYKFDQDFEIEFVSSSSRKRQTRKVKGVITERISEKREADSKDEKPADYTYHSLSDQSIGIIDFRALRDLELFKSFLQETFARIQKDSIQSLIIDIRENPGGNSALGDELLSYITDKPFAQTSRIQLKVSKQIKKFYRTFQPWYKRWIPMKLLPWETYFRKIWSTPEGSLAVFPSHPKEPGENPLRFKGKVYVLIGPHTYSSAVLFATAFKDYDLGTLIGEETGGLCTSYGDVYFFDLPKTHTQIGASHKRFVRPSGEDDGRGVIPHHEVKQSVEDLQKGIDTVMEFAKNFAKSHHTKPKLDQSRPDPDFDPIFVCI